MGVLIEAEQLLPIFNFCPDKFLYSKYCYVFAGTGKVSRGVARCFNVGTGSDDAEEILNRLGLENKTGCNERADDMGNFI